MRFTFGLVALAALGLVITTLGSGPAKAQGLSYFYCYVPSPKDGKTFVSDVHPVGPVAERRSYGDQFVSFLQSKGKISGGAVGYCVMRATMREIDKGRSDITQMPCGECGGAERMVDVAWARGGTPVASVLVSRATAPSNSVSATKAANEPPPVVSRELLLSGAEAAQVLEFFFEKLPVKIDDNDRRFAQSLILESARASSQMGVAEALFKSAISPTATPSRVVKSIAVRVLKELAQPDTVQAALARDHYGAVVSELRLRWKSPWDERIELDDSSMLSKLWE